MLLSKEESSMDKNYKIANLKEQNFEELRKLEDKIKMETGRDFVLIAWENEKSK
jgi:hypothetical protein